MSITDLNKIDIIATRPDSDVVKLVITDPLGWEDTHGHAALLQEKINTYIAFIESGQLATVKEPPIPESPEVWITLVAQQQPSQDGQEFLTQVDEFLRGIGLRFEIQLR